MGENTIAYDHNGNIVEANGLRVLYDHTGICAVKYNGSTYFYRKNAQNDIVALLDNTGAVVVEYKYNAWGKCKILNPDGTENTSATFIGNMNPFRYRSYYYDVNTGLYYLKSRFYDPETGRFLNADSIDYLEPDTVNGLNLYAYCRNNPVMGYDPNGTWDWGSFWKKTFGIAMGLGLLAITVAGVILSGGTLLVPILVGAGLGMAANAIGQGVGNLLSGKSFFDNFSFSSLIMAGLAGAAFATGLGGFFGTVAIGAMANSGTAALQSKSWAQIGLSAVAGGFSAGIGYGVGRLISYKLFGSNDLSFADFYQLTHLDANLIRSVGASLRASWYTFLPNISTSATRGLSTYLGNKGINIL